MPDHQPNDQAKKTEAALAEFEAKMTELRQERLDLMKRVVKRVEDKKIAEVEAKLRNQS